MNGSPLLTLALAIAAEVIGTAALKASDGMTRPGPALLTGVSYAAAFYCMSLAMRDMPIGVIYALWSGAGIVLISLAGWALFGERLDAPAVLGIGLIVAGVLVLNLLSDTARL